MDKNYPQPSKTMSLELWLMGSFGAFVLMGTFGLAAFFQHLTVAEHKLALESLGRANRLFLSQNQFPRSRQMADQLGQVMGAKVYFKKSDQSLSALVADGKVRLHGGEYKVGFLLKDGYEVWFSKKVEKGTQMSFLKRLDAQLALGGFWSLSLLFSLFVGRKVTKPLKDLAWAIPQIGAEAPLKGLPHSGLREISNLGQALAQTHSSLLEERKKRKQAERLALLGKMATNLSHEMKNPIAAIRLHAQLLEKSCREEEKVSVNLIFSESERMEIMLQQWLQYAIPKRILLKNPIRWEQIASRACNNLSLQAAYAGVKIQQEITPVSEEKILYGDADRLFQVLLNLLLNAIQNMPKGGIITLRAANNFLEVEIKG